MNRYLYFSIIFNTNDLSNFFEEEVFKKVDFVDATDNYYLGESGTVKITMVESGYSLDHDDEGKEFKDYWYEFIYNKTVSKN
jgi:hypothetical protein